jgi:hypothetical protein
METTLPSAFLTKTSVFGDFDLTEAIPAVNSATHTAPITPVETYIAGTSSPKRAILGRLFKRNIAQYKAKPAAEERSRIPIMLA